MAKSFRRLIVLLCSLLVSSCSDPLTERDDLVQLESRRCPKGEVDSAQLAAVAQAASDRSGVAIAHAVTVCSHSSVTCRPVSVDQGRTLEYLYQLIDEELARYPQGFISRFGPEQIWVVNDLKSEMLGRDAAGIAVYSGRIVYLSIPEDCGSSSFRRMIQHELFHMFDPRIVRDQKWEEAWNKNNPPGFSYVGHRSVSSQVAGADQPIGFASWYARTTAYEDRAESYAHRLVAPYAAALRRRSLIDQYLNAKQDTLASWLIDVWPELSGLLVESP